MKQFRLSVAVLLAAWSLAGPGAHADNGSGTAGSPSVQVAVKASENKKVRLYTPTQVPVDVALIDADGNVLYAGTVAKQSAGRQSFNLSHLPDGQYYLTASTNAWWMSQGITVRGNAVTVDTRSRQQVAQPTLTEYGKNKVEVTLPTTNVANANVVIYDEQNLPVSTAQLSGSSRRFDLSSLPDGTYTFVVGAAQKQFTSRVAVRH